MKKESGVITLEACITVLSFLILMLLISSLFVMFMAQNETAHVVLQTSESMSIDSYAGEKIGIGNTEGVSGLVTLVLNSIEQLTGFDNSQNTNFATNVKFDEDESTLSKTIKERFIAYLSGGDEDEADKQLKNLNVVDGINGISFKESYIKDDVLYIVLKYDLKYEFQIWGLDKVPVKQTTCSKLWRGQ